MTTWVWRRCDAPNPVLGRRSNLVQLFIELQRSDAAPPSKLPGDSAACRSCGLSKTQGLIIIRADLGSPTAYPAPGSRVNTTLYARRKDDALGSGKVLTKITP